MIPNYHTDDEKKLHLDLLCKTKGDRPDLDDFYESRNSLLKIIGARRCSTQECNKLLLNIRKSIAKEKIRNIKKFCARKNS